MISSIDFNVTTKGRFKGVFEGIYYHRSAPWQTILTTIFIGVFWEIKKPSQNELGFVGY